MWQTIPNFPRYEASRDGRIRLKSTKRELCQRNNQSRANVYKRVTLFIRSSIKPDAPLRRKDMFVHRLVALAHLDTDPRSTRHLEVDHLNRDTLNNHVSNLEWVTPAENKRRYLEAA